MPGKKKSPRSNAGFQIGGNVSVTHGDIVAGDKTVNVDKGGVFVGGHVEGSNIVTGDGDQVGNRQAEQQAFFDELLQRIEQRPNTSLEDKDDLKANIAEIKAEAEKGEQADETFLSRRLRNIARIAPEIGELMLATLTKKRSTNVSHAESPATGKVGHVFISYRRADSADVVGRIYDRLVEHYGPDPIFKDVDSIPLGTDFKQYLDRKVSECRVLLAIIGDRWVEATDATGNKRLADHADFVRVEIESALNRGIAVIPLLVRGAQMPTEDELPHSLRQLVYKNGLPIRPDPDFHRDMDRLITALDKYI